MEWIRPGTSYDLLLPTFAAMYWVKTPSWLRSLFSSHLIWNVPADGKPVVYLTFDDGPHPVATPFALEQLAAYGAKATFFCLGKCIAEFPGIYRDTLDGGHTTGNHTHNHLNGWKTKPEDYLENIHKAAGLIDSPIFRPPYGRIRRAQVKLLIRDKTPWKIYMWDVLSADFDTVITPQQCLDNVLKHICPGSIVVFHDSAKAWDRMQYALPKVLDHCRERGWACLPLPT